MAVDVETRAQIQSDSANVLSTGMYGRLFPDHLKIIPQLNEVYELALAYYESQILTENEILDNGAYFARVGEQTTRHFRMCTGEPVRLPQYSSSRLKSFFSTNQFKTGYATHGLFPYRGKFHPQMIKALINVMGLKPGDVIVDPMMGSGTVLIEASLMGIHSIGIDASPFCQFMTQAKLNGLVIPLSPLLNALEKRRELFELFSRRTDVSYTDYRVSGHFADLIGLEAPHIQNFLLLAYLDSAGYAERSQRKDPFEQFSKILERYVFVVEKIQRVLNGQTNDLGHALPLTGDARTLPIRDKSVDGVLFSPPYSFAIDYLKNDAIHLNYMGQDTETLRKKMIGLRGKGLREKFDLYMKDMSMVLAEIGRVLKLGALCTIVIGTNENQLSKVLGVSHQELTGLHEHMVHIASNCGFKPVRLLPRQIFGMANTMRQEYIVILQKIYSS